MVKKKRVIGMFPEYMLQELKDDNEIYVDSLGRVQGFTEFVERMYLMNKRKGGY